MEDAEMQLDPEMSMQDVDTGDKVRRRDERAVGRENATCPPLLSVFFLMWCCCFSIEILSIKVMLIDCKHL